MTRWRHPNHGAAESLPPELQRPGVPAAARAWVERAVGRGIVAARRLAGASTSVVHRVGLDDGTAVVLRRYVWRWVIDDEPIGPRREVDALTWAGRRGLPVPQVVAADTTGADVGDGIPALLMTLLPGRAQALPDPVRLAEVTSLLHAHDGGGLGHEYAPWYDGWALRPPSNSRDPILWERAMAIWRGTQPAHEPAFIHRDLNLGNVLWSRGTSTGVVDLAVACRGPRGCDVATCRGDLLGRGGVELADRFRDAYESITGVDHHPYWEIANVMEHGPSPWTPDDIDLAEPRLAAALAALG